MSEQSEDENPASSEDPLPGGDVVKKQIAYAWIAEFTMKTKSVICPLTVDLTKPIFQDKLPFYCVHSINGAGGAELGYLARFLTSNQPFFAIQTPTDLRKKEFAKSIVSLAEYYCNVLLTFHKLIMAKHNLFSVVGQRALSLRWRWHNNSPGFGKDLPCWSR